MPKAETAKRFLAAERKPAIPPRLAAGNVEATKNQRRDRGPLNGTGSVRVRRLVFIWGIVSRQLAARQAESQAEGGLRPGSSVCPAPSEGKADNGEAGCSSQGALDIRPRRRQEADGERHRRGATCQRRLPTFVGACS